MRLKIRLARSPNAASADLLVSFESSASVGALATYISKSDPLGNPNSDAALTLALVDSNSTPLPPHTRLVESGIRSGSEVVLVPIEAGNMASSVGHSAVVRIVSGPDTGREFRVATGTSIVGRDHSCEVRLSDPSVSREHAKLHITDVAELVDLGSANGLLVGDDLAERVLIRPGDTVQLGDTVLTVIVVTPSGNRGADPVNIGFNRPPRVESHFEGNEMTAPEPPAPSHTQRFPIIPLFAPLILGVVIYFSTHNISSLLFVALSPIMMIGNVAEGRLAGKRAYIQALELFHADVADLVAEATANADQERGRRCVENPPIGDCLDAIRGHTSLLWSRAPGLNGFLEIRLGIGRQPSRSQITLPQGNQKNRALWRELGEAVAPFAWVDDVPIVAKLTGGSALGVGGPREAALGAMRSLLLQICALHSPAEVVIVACVSSRDESNWDWLKWMPHCASPQSPVKVSELAATVVACDGLVSDLERLIKERSERAGQSGRSNQEAFPAVVMVIDDDAPLNRPRAIQIAEQGPASGVYVLWMASDTSRLPAVCREFLDLSPAPEGASVGVVRTGDKVQPVKVESVSETVATVAARSLAPVIDLAAGDNLEGDLPRSVSFLSLTSPELAMVPEAVIDRWTESRSIVYGPRASVVKVHRPGSLRAVVGQSASGPYVLDLRSQGPHALVGGTTGSGKSELLQSWILGMAIAHSPQRVTFLLVDYKGGSAFSECVHLPHTVGLVTDLSPHLVRRALVSLAAELRYREEVLHRKGAKDLLELERSGDPDAPPSLVIIVDEFAALAQEVPDFVDGVVNVAQRGRSLGLHLILATQRPAGVIKDNLRANTNLRLALRMADESDSVDVLGSGQAATFDPSVPGRAVSRTGPSQFVPFQAAYTGGWTEQKQPEADITVEVFGFGPSQTWELPQTLLSEAHDPGPTDIQRIVRTVRDASDVAEIVSPRMPWLPELASAYDLAKLPTARRDDSLVFGVVDDPKNQRQPTVSFYPDKDGNLAVFGTGGAGKSALLRTLAVASGFTVRGGPCHVYGIDFGSRGLQMLEDLPHVGSIVAGGDHERITRLLGLLRSTIDERAVRYAKADAGTITDYRRLSGETKEPRILLLLDGMAAFRTAYEGTEYNRWFETFVGIAADGRPVGVHAIISADRLGAIPTSLASQVQRRVVLRLADANDYSLMGLASDVLDNNSPPGRGLFDESEVQVAVLGGTADVFEQSKAVRLFGASMRAAGAHETEPVKQLSDHVLLSELPENVGGAPTVGISGLTLNPVAFVPVGTFLVAGPPGSGRSTTLASVVTALKRWNPGLQLFYIGNSRSPLAGWNAWERSATSPEDAAQLAAELPGLVGEGAAGNATSAIIIEGVVDYVGSLADFAMQEMIKKVVALGQLVIGEGETTALNASYPLLVMMRSGRSGIVLQPDQLDGNILRVQFPRLRKSDFPAGRGLLVSRGAQPELLQVALSDLILAT